MLNMCTESGPFLNGVCVCVVYTHIMPHLWGSEGNFWESVYFFHLVELELLLLSKAQCAPGLPAHKLLGNSPAPTSRIATRLLGLQPYTTASGSLRFHPPSFLPGASSKSFQCSLGVQFLTYFTSIRLHTLAAQLHGLARSLYPKQSLGLDLRKDAEGLERQLRG